MVRLAPFIAKKEIKIERTLLWFFCWSSEVLFELVRFIHQMKINKILLCQFGIPLALILYLVYSIRLNRIVGSKVNKKS